MSRSAKADNIRQQDELQRELTPEQELALGALLEGLTDAQAAERAGVSRQTVNGWKHKDAVFVARLNAERQALWTERQDKLRALVADAIDTLAAGLDSGDERRQLAAAVHILRATGIYGHDLTPTGAVDPVDVVALWRADELARSIMRF